MCGGHGPPLCGGCRMGGHPRCRKFVDPYKEHKGELEPRVKWVVCPMYGSGSAPKSVKNAVLAERCSTYRGNPRVRRPQEPQLTVLRCRVGGGGAYEVPEIRRSIQETQRGTGALVKWVVCPIYGSGSAPKKAKTTVLLGRCASYRGNPPVRRPRESRRDPVGATKANERICLLDRGHMRCPNAVDPYQGPKRNWKSREFGRLSYLRQRIRSEVDKHFGFGETVWACAVVSAKGNLLCGGAPAKVPRTGRPGEIVGLSSPLLKADPMGTITPKEPTPKADAQQNADSSYQCAPRAALNCRDTDPGETKRGDVSDQQTLH